MAAFTPAPWCIPPGSETCVCAGDDGTKPGKILFVLRGPSGKREVYSHELLSEYSAYIAKVVNSHDALVEALFAVREALEKDSLSRAERITDALDIATGALASVPRHDHSTPGETK